MRYATVILSWDGPQFHPLDEAVAGTGNVHIEATQYINPMGDGTHVELARFRGDMQTLAEMLEEAPGVIDFEVPEKSGFVYVHYESTPLMETLLTIVFEHRVVLLWPLEFVTDAGTRSIRATFMGPEAAWTNVTREIPDDLDLTLVRTGTNTDAIGDPMLTLTEKQRRLFESAVQAGYYAVPRETTQAELANELEITQSTISDRLQRLESTLLTSLLPRGTDTT